MRMVTVLSDIIRHFNPAVLLPVCPPGKGVAHHGAEDLWIQAEELVRSLKENQQLDFQHDWKLINVFFSNASRCYLCPSIQQERHVKNDMERLARTLDYLQEEVPKAFVNLVDLSEIAAVSHWHQGAGLSDHVPEPCHCPEKTSKLDKVIMQWSYQEAWESLLASSRFSDQESFAVVFQPFFYEMLLPSVSGQGGGVKGGDGSSQKAHPDKLYEHQCDDAIFSPVVPT
ncbi:phospholipase B1, membrane-associated-like [Dipodomys merriami]|uniref:phospholipase B1, membrane-associated-like n=1 Tax=Dipodomys merriami TaxID=94247 RepID=UPI0038556ED3